MVSSRGGTGREISGFGLRRAGEVGFRASPRARETLTDKQNVNILLVHVLVIPALGPEIQLN